MSGVVEALAIAVPLAGGFGAGVLHLGQTWLQKQKPKSEQSMDAAQATAILVKAASDAAAAHIEGMRKDFDGLRAAMSAQSNEFAELKRSHAECEERCEALTVKGRRRDEIIERLIRQYADPASTQPGGDLHNVIIELRDGGALVLPAPEAKP